MQDPDRRAPEQRGSMVSVAALLEREGHPLTTEVASGGGGIGRGKIVGLAAGTMLVAGAVAASALGLSGHARTHAEAGGQPVPGAAGHGSAGGVTEYPAQQVDNRLPASPHQDAAPQTTAPEAAPTSQARPAPAPEHHATPRTTHQSAPSTTQAQTPEQAPVQAPVQQPQPQQQTQTRTQQQTQQSASTGQTQQGGLGATLQDVVTPVTQTVDNTLQPALSMIPLVGGLLGG